jgi:ABC-type Na+ efflux pump permease subunit
MSRIFHVALREFLATVATKGFIFGVLVTPFLLLLLIVVMPRFINAPPPRVEGEVALIDPTGEVAAGLRDYLRPEKIAERRQARMKKLEAATPEAIRQLSGSSPQARAAARQALEQAAGQAPDLGILALDPSVSLEQAKAPLRAEAGKNRDGEGQRLALAVIHTDAIVRGAGKETFGGYDLYVRAKLDDRIEDEIRAGLRETILGARIRASGLDRGLIDALTRVEAKESVTVTTGGERRTNEVVNALLPGGLMLLLMVSVMTGGSSLLTTTVEEKSNRVVEILLSAVSPAQLLVGKILGQMAVGFVVLALYAGLGIAALVSFAMMGLVDPMLLVFLLIFFLLAYFTMASLLGAIGAAVSEMREAQSLMTPVMLMMMVPWVLWMPISRSPDSLMAVVLSFLPPVNNFAMLLRLSSTSPPPMWQAWLSVLIGAAGAYAALWFAAKVFRIGLLMYGKPPSLRTLVRWARMA